MKNIIFIAPPASGKGTQSAILEKKYNLIHISTGNLLRQEALKDTELGRYISEVLASGGLVKNEIAYDIVYKRLKESDCQNGYVLDGYPRNIEQAYDYDKILKELNQVLGYVIVLDIKEETLEKRVTGRRVCENCKAVYNINSETEKPKVESICDKCGGRLYQRNDDNVTSFKHRYNLYLEKTKPLLDYYREKGILYVINGDDTITNIASNIDKVIKEGM